jgi:hypothetical protein
MATHSLHGRRLSGWSCGAYNVCVTSLLAQGTAVVAIMSDQGAIKPLARNAQIVIGAQIVGVLIFLAIAYFIDVGPDAQIPFLNYVVFAVSAVALPLSFILPGVVATRQRKAIAKGIQSTAAGAGRLPIFGPETEKMQASSLPMGYMQQLIIGAALNEGAAFLAVVAYLIEKDPVLLGLAVVLILGQVARFPTVSRIEHWIEEQQQKLLEEQLSG